MDIFEPPREHAALGHAVHQPRLRHAAGEIVRADAEAGRDDDRERPDLPHRGTGDARQRIVLARELGADRDEGPDDRHVEQRHPAHHGHDRERDVALGMLELARRLDHALEADEGVEGQQDDRLDLAELRQRHRAHLAAREEGREDQRAQRQQLDRGHHAQRADRGAHAVEIDRSDQRQPHRHRDGRGDRSRQPGEQRGEIGDHHMHVRRRGHDRAGIARPAGLEADEAPEGGLAIKHRSAAMLEPRGHPGIAQRQRQEEDPADQHHPRREIAHRRHQHCGQR